MIRIQEATVYEVRGEQDTSEGRSGTYLVGWYLHSTAAHQASEHKGVWGQPGAVFPRTVKVVIDSDGQWYVIGEKLITDPRLEDPQEVRARALKKLHAADLTSAEREALSEVLSLESNG